MAKFQVVAGYGVASARAFLSILTRIHIPSLSTWKRGTVYILPSIVFDMKRVLASFHR